VLRYSSAIAKAIPYEVVHIDLNDDILVARDANGILAICEQRFTEFNEVNIATALHRVVKYSVVDTTRERPILRRLLDVFSEPLRQGQRCDAPHLLNTAWAYAKLLFVDYPLLHSISAHARGRITEFDTPQLATIAWA